MSIILSELDSSIVVDSEFPFDYFSRITTKREGNKCVFLADEKYISKLDDSVSMVITNKDIADKIRETDLKCGFCLSNEPRGQFFELLIAYEKKVCRFEKTIIQDNSNISKKATISEIGVRIGRNVVIGDYAQILPGTTIGNDVVIQGGAIVGAQLFNTYKYKGKHIQIPQCGKTVINNNVLIGSNSVVAQAMYSYGETTIGEGTKVDALASISHNDTIGSNCLICAGAILGGYVSVGNDTEIALGARVKNSVNIGSNVMIGMGSVMLFDAKDGESWFGNPAKRMK